MVRVSKAWWSCAFLSILLFSGVGCGRPVLKHLYEQPTRDIAEIDSCVVDKNGLLNVRVKLSDIEFLVLQHKKWQLWSREMSSGDTVIFISSRHLVIGERVWKCSPKGVLDKQPSALTKEEALSAKFVLVSLNSPPMPLPASGEPMEPVAIGPPVVPTGELHHPRDIRGTRTLYFQLYTKSGERPCNGKTVLLGEPCQSFRTPPIPANGPIKGLLRNVTYPAVYSVCYAIDATLLATLSPLTGGASLSALSLLYARVPGVWEELGK